MMDKGTMARALYHAENLARFVSTFRTKGVSRYRDNILEATSNLITGEVRVRLEDDARTVVLRSDPFGKVVEFHEGNWVRYLNDAYFMHGKEISKGKGRTEVLVAKRRARAFSPVNDADLFTKEG